MEPAKVGLEAYLEGITINDPKIPVVANVTAEAVASGAEIRTLLTQQVTSPVKWSQTMNYLVDNGVTKVIEIGPGKVLSGLAKRDMRPESIINLDTLEDINNFK